MSIFFWKTTPAQRETAAFQPYFSDFLGTLDEAAPSKENFPYLVSDELVKQWTTRTGGGELGLYVARYHTPMKQGLIDLVMKAFKTNPMSSSSNEQVRVDNVATMWMICRQLTCTLR